jgi:hypothetical protein
MRPPQRIRRGGKNLAFSLYNKILHSVQDDNYNCRVNNESLVMSQGKEMLFGPASKG